jgi:flagella basal body P-ring formation protein FlgA
MTQSRVLLQAAAVSAGIAPSAAGNVQIESLLLAKLGEQYPAVVRWEVHPFGKARVSDNDAMSVARLGSRSAVRVGDRVYWYAVEGFQAGFSATRVVHSGEPLDATSARAGEIDALAAGCAPLTDASRLAGARARRSMHEGQVICEDAVEPRPPVARGDELTVHYAGTRISLVTKGVAQTDGALGESVEVKKPDTGERYVAVVSGNREVTINE